MHYPDRSSLSRRSVLGVGAMLGLSPVLPAAAGVLRGTRSRSDDSLAHFPQQHPDLVSATVGASHGNFDRVRELVTAHPTLANAAWDWGFGDWETALGAASHVGNREIALFLIEHGARPDLFTFAMLGHLSAVRAMIEARNGIQRIHGPHGITLLAHARAGRDAAREVYDYLQTIEGADEPAPSQPISAEELTRYTGAYRVVDHNFTINITESRGRLMLQREELSGRVLFRRDGHIFFPAGAPHVRIEFEIGGDALPSSVTVRDHDLVVVGRRE